MAVALKLYLQNKTKTDIADEFSSYKPPKTPKTPKASPEKVVLSFKIPDSDRISKRMSIFKGVEINQTPFKTKSN
jgi:hypothetical protein